MIKRSYAPISTIRDIAVSPKGLKEIHKILVNEEKSRGNHRTYTFLSPVDFARQMSFGEYQHLLDSNVSVKLGIANSTGLVASIFSNACKENLEENFSVDDREEYRELVKDIVEYTYYQYQGRGQEYVYGKLMGLVKGAQKYQSDVFKGRHRNAQKRNNDEEVVGRLERVKISVRNALFDRKNNRTAGKLRALEAAIEISNNPYFETYLREVIVAPERGASSPREIYERLNLNMCQGTYQNVNSLLARARVSENLFNAPSKNKELKNMIFCAK